MRISDWSSDVCSSDLVAVLENGVRQTMLLVTDDIEREEGLTDGQRRAFRRITDAAITLFKEKLTEAFQDYYANREDHNGSATQRLVDSSGDTGAIPDRKSVV